MSDVPTDKEAQYQQAVGRGQQATVCLYLSDKINYFT